MWHKIEWEILSFKKKYLVKLLKELYPYILNINISTKALHLFHYSEPKKKKKKRTEMPLKNNKLNGFIFLFRDILDGYF